MDFKAQPTTVSDLFSLQKSYRVARNQRDFSWLEEHVDELWSDIIRNIKYNEVTSQIETNEYFVGSVVLSGHEDSTELTIIDGQQRTTVLTIMLCAIRDALVVSNPTAAKAINDTFIEGSRLIGGLNPSKFFKLIRTSDSNYFTCQIQSIEKIDAECLTQEDELLRSAYQRTLEKVKPENLIKEIFRTNEVLSNRIAEVYSNLVEQITSKIKLVRIIVDNENDAYIIFEILNARGKDLDSSDLIKNAVFSDLRRTHPIDYAKTRWEEIRDHLSDRSKQNSLSEFIRYWWNARHQVVSQDNLFKAVKESLDRNDISSGVLLESLKSSAGIYKKICDPEDSDWNATNYKRVIFPLTAMKIFNVKMPRPILLTLFERHFAKKISQADFIRAIRSLEDFHFLFTAICSQRPTGIENIYSRISKQLIASTNRGTSSQIVTDLQQKLNLKKPTKDVFAAKLTNIELTKQKTTDKALLKYIFKRYESYVRGNDELIPFDITLEHIRPISLNEPKLGTVGNLLPLGLDGNNNVGSNPFPQKLLVYAQSNYKVTTEFATEHSAKTLWESSEIETRNEYLSEVFYNQIWKII